MCSARDKKNTIEDVANVRDRSLKLVYIVNRANKKQWKLLSLSIIK